MIRIVTRNDGKKVDLQVSSWKQVKAYLNLNCLSHVFVLSKGKGYNCSLTKTGRLQRD